MTNEEFQIQVLEELRNIKSDINDIIEDNKSIHEILGEHEISIRTLRRTI